MTGSGARGFTLLEVLVATTLIALLGVMLFAGFRMAFRTWDAGEERAARTDEMRLVSGFIRRQLERTVPLMVREGRQWRLRFSGEKDRIRFVSEMSSRLGPGGLYELTIEQSAEGERRSVRLRRRLVHPDLDPSQPPAEGDEVTLLDAASGLEFSYFGSSPGGGDPDWTSRWESARRLPELVKVETGVEGQGEWPPVVVRLRVERPVYERAAPGSGSRGREPATAAGEN